MDPSVVPTTAAINTFFTNIAGASNRYIWSNDELIWEVSWLPGRTAKWISDNLYRLIDFSGGGAIANVRDTPALGVRSPVTSTCRLLQAGVATRRYVRGWLGPPPKKVNSYLPYTTATLNGWTRLYEPAFGVQVVMELQYLTGKIINGTYHQYQTTGEVYSDETYANGLENGAFVWYHPPPNDAQAQWTATYVNGLIQGTLSEYDIFGGLLNAYTVIDSVIQP